MTRTESRAGLALRARRVIAHPERPIGHSALGVPHDAGHSTTIYEYDRTSERSDVLCAWALRTLAFVE